MTTSRRDGQREDPTRGQLAKKVESTLPAMSGNLLGLVASARSMSQLLWILKEA